MEMEEIWGFVGHFQRDIIDVLKVLSLGKVKILTEYLRPLVSSVMMFKGCSNAIISDQPSLITGT